MSDGTIYSNIDALILSADKLGITVPEIYEIYRNAQQSMAFVQIVFTLIWLVGVILTFVGVFIYSNKLKEKDDKHDPFFEATIISMCIGGLLLFVLMGLYAPTIAYCCPEYSTLQSLIAECK